MAKNVASATTKRRATAGSKKKSVAKNLHVVRHTEGWVIRSDGSTRVTSLHETQQEAIKAARALAKRAEITLVIHGPDGRVQQWNYYSRDPLPRRKPREVLYPLSPPETATADEIARAVRAAISEASHKESKKLKVNDRVVRGNKSQRQSKAN